MRITPDEITKQLLEELLVGFGVANGAIYLDDGHHDMALHATPGWNGLAELTIPLKSSEHAAHLGLN